MKCLVDFHFQMLCICYVWNFNIILVYFDSDSTDQRKHSKTEYIDTSPLPFLNKDLEIDDTYPSAVEAFHQKIVAADSILFASPEYNYSVTGTSAAH